MAEIGARLRDARMRAGLDVDEVEMRTKIRAKYLRAMENEEWDLLPGDVYVRSFLRSYGTFLGLDTRQLIDDFRREFDPPADHEPPPIVPPSRERGRGRAGSRRPRVAPWVLTAFVLVIVVLVLGLVSGHSFSSSSPNVHAAPARTTSRHRPSGHRRRAPRRRSAAARRSQVRLSLVATGQVYVCLVDGRGRKLIAGRTFSAGQTIPTETAGKLLLTLGNAQATLRVNGAPVPVTASASPIGYQFTPGHTRSLPPSAQPTCT